MIPIINNDRYDEYLERYFRSQHEELKRLLELLTEYSVRYNLQADEDLSAILFRLYHDNPTHQQLKFLL